MTGLPFFAGVICGRTCTINALFKAFQPKIKMNNKSPWLQKLQYDSQFSVDLLEPFELTCLSQDQIQA